MKRRLLWVGDAVVDSGFARVTHKVLDILKDCWDVTVVGLNYYGDPHPYPYHIYPAMAGGQGLLKRLPPIVEKISPDLTILLNDPWNIPPMMKLLYNYPVMAVVAVDGRNCRGYCLNGCKRVIFWTEFAKQEAHLGGYTGPSDVIPLGVDLDIYKPQEQLAARRAVGIPIHALDGFIVGNVNRNQPRKRLDLSIEYFAHWVHKYSTQNAYLFLHVAPTGDVGFDCPQLAAYHGISTRLIMSDPGVFFGLTERHLAKLYACFDVQINTGQGEGWGLPTMEGMACGVPQIVGDWSGLGEWAADVAALVPCTTTITTSDNINSIGGILNKGHFAHRLHTLYSSEIERQTLRTKGLQLVNEKKFRWETIGQQFLESCEQAYASPLEHAVEEEIV
jgi:D-inositol-3-phosphate glycosyltransferase